jgi:hypothetical protein
MADMMMIVPGLFAIGGVFRLKTRLFGAIERSEGDPGRIQADRNSARMSAMRRSRLRSLPTVAEDRDASRAQWGSTQPGSLANFSELSRRPSNRTADGDKVLVRIDAPVAADVSAENVAEVARLIHAPAAAAELPRLGNTGQGQRCGRRPSAFRRSPRR